MNFKVIVAIVLFVASISISLGITIWWGFNAELTSMQIFLKWWWLYLIMIGGLLLSRLIFLKNYK